jgi:hypothetical protein
MIRRITCTLIAGLFLFTSGCTSWVVTEASTVPTVIAAHPSIRVLKLDGTVLSIDNALFRNDSIIGVSGGAPIAVARAEVKQIAVRETDGGKTAAMVIFGIVGGAVLLFTAFLFALGATAD